ncbi:hypothetical protein GCM10027425_10460 [Alteromonas gracilis]
MSAQLEVVGTIVAIGTAVFAVILSCLQVVKQDRDRRSDVADKVVGWIGVEGWDAAGNDRGVVLQNDTGLALRNVDVVIYTGGVSATDSITDRIVQRYSVIPPGTYYLQCDPATRQLATPAPVDTGEGRLLFRGAIQSEDVPGTSEPEVVTLVPASYKSESWIIEALQFHIAQRLWSRDRYGMLRSRNHLADIAPAGEVLERLKDSATNPVKPATKRTADHRPDQNVVHFFEAFFSRLSPDGTKVSSEFRGWVESAKLSSKRQTLNITLTGDRGKVRIQGSGNGRIINEIVHSGSGQNVNLKNELPDDLRDLNVKGGMTQQQQEQAVEALIAFLRRFPDAGIGTPST